MVKKYISKKKQAERRTSDELFDSKGTYSASDIDAIFEIQKGKCYFTGAPISKEGKDYSIDHLTPIKSKGSSWPGNLALVKKEINTDKKDYTKVQYWKFLERKKGRKFVAQRKIICAEIDEKRRLIDRQRKKQVRDNFKNLEQQLIDQFPANQVSLELSHDIPILRVDGITVESLS